MQVPTRLGNCQRGRKAGVLRAFTLFASFSIAGCADLDASLAPNFDLSLGHWSSPSTEPVVTALHRVWPASTQTVLRSLISARKSTSTPDPVLAFYEARNFQPAWSGGRIEDQMAKEVRAMLARAHEQGLSDEDYQLSKDVRPKPGPVAAGYDLALTEAVLSYSRDVRMGRVRPSDIYTDVGLPAPNFDAVAGLTQALKNHSVAKFLADLPPPHPKYRRLAQALAQYRAIADAGGWPSVPDKSEIKLEGDDPRLKLLVKRLAFEDSALTATSKPSAAALRQALKRFQARHGLDADGNVGRETLAALNVPARVRVAEIAANMERWRWMPREFERRYIAVNVPDQSLEYVREGTVVLSSRVVVGNKANATPITRSTIVAIVANPPWNIPGFIAARDLLPRLRQNPNYLVSRNMVVTDGPPGDPQGRTIAWRKIIPATFPYAIRQLPGPNTALGALMLDSPNDFDVYLHDTPNKKLFELNQREISNGCVRVQQIFPLASLALTDDADEGMDRLTKATKTHKTQRLELESPLPVYFLYWTALSGPSGEVEFRPDRYGRDAPLIALLTKTDVSPATSKSRMSVTARAEPSPSEAEDISP